MPDFDELFEKAEGGPIIYKGLELVRVDRFPVANKEKIILSIESTNSTSPQGAIVSIKGYCKRNGDLCKKGKKVNLVCWEDAEGYDPKHIELTVYTKEGFVTVWNMWEGTTTRTSVHQFRSTTQTQIPSVCYWLGGAAMIVEEIENGRRYRCNDRDPDEDFDDIIFTVTRVS